MVSTHTAMFRVILNHTTRSGISENHRHQNRKPTSIQSKIDINLLFGLCQMTAILDCLTTMQCLKYLLTKPRLRRKVYKFTIQPVEKVGHLGF